jgi:hypothetical protein
MEAMTSETTTTRAAGRWRRGFTRAGGLIQGQIRKAGEQRGFAESRLLTHWAEIVGVETARQCQPVKISYGRGGLGATLTLLAKGAAAPMLQVQLPGIRERVNACYGYNAVARIHITQTAATGFAEPAAPFEHAPAPKPQPSPIPAIDEVSDPGLRAALEGLGARINCRN